MGLLSGRRRGETVKTVERSILIESPRLAMSRLLNSSAEVRKTIDDAIRMANDSVYGLGGAVWSRDKEKAMTVAKQMRTGTVWINEYHMLSVAAPFGGYKQSGIGREFGMQGMLEYMQTKHVHVDQVDNRAAKFWYGALFGA